VKVPKVIYFFDPLCVTCFSFGPAISALMEKYGSSFYFDIVAGGMVTGGRVGPLSQKSEYLQKKIEAIENTTGVLFGDPYKEVLKEGTVISDSEPPSIAFNVFKSFRPDLRFQIAHSIQQLHFREGRDLNLMKSYFTICERYEVNKFGFMDRFQDPAYRELTQTLFQQVEHWGVKHFPTLMTEEEGELILIQEGYSPLEELESTFLRIVQGQGMHPVN
jgi:putative protein-disulfide isomerase